MIELTKIQTELKAPKNQFNQFGKYKYRSCEDILEALKPVALKHECTVTISDKIVLIGDRHYIEATATITNKESVSISTTAYAREAFTKKGMDESQITGSASSYARKYALNGLFLIDDTKDSDTHDNSKQPARTTITPGMTQYWNRAKTSYIANGNFDAVLKHADISEENQKRLIEEAKLEKTEIEGGV